MKGIEVEATSTGYYGNKIIREGQKFIYEGAVVNGKLPLWVKAVGKFEPEVEVEVEVEVKVEVKAEVEESRMINSEEKKVLKKAKKKFEAQEII